MRAQPRENQDSQVIKKICGWAEKTRSALYKGKPVPACSKFMLSSFVHSLCSIHRNRTLPDEANETIGCENHHYLYIALRLCYDFRLKLRNKVSLLLREIFLCEKSLEAIFSILQHCPGSMRLKSDVNINTYTLYPRTRQLERSAFEYFLKSICPLGRDIREKEKTVYTPENVINRGIDACGTTPLMAATIRGDLALVLLLLRHGADPLLYERGDDMDCVKRSPVGFIIDKLNISALLKGSAWARSAAGGESQYPKDAARQSEENSVTCLSYFSRAVYALDIRESSQSVITTATQEQKFSEGIYFEVRPNVTEMVDIMTSFRQPPTLRHACRYVIRRAVASAGMTKISTALKELPVPVIVQKFLDLRS